MLRNTCLLLVCLLVSGGCAGYRLGPTNGDAARSKSVQVALFQNETYEPRLSEALGTALRRSLQQDGTYTLGTRGQADVVLTGVITKYQRLGISYNPQDVITP